MGNVDSFQFDLPDDSRVRVTSGEVFIKLPRATGASTDTFHPGYTDAFHEPVSHLPFHDDLLV